MLFLGRLTAINHSYFEKLSSIVRVDASYVLVCFGPGRAGLGLECVGPGRASGLSTSGRAGPRAWVEDFGPGSGLEFRPVATSINLFITFCSHLYGVVSSCNLLEVCFLYPRG